MKKIFVFALAAISLFASCQKAVVEKVEPAKEPLVFTAGIESSKTAIVIDGEQAKINWESGDQITITDNNSKTAVYQVKSADVGKQSAEFEYVSGETELTAPYTATYGSVPSPSVVQNYSASASVPLYMTAPSTSTTSFSFTAQCGVLKIKLTDATHSVSRIIVSDGVKEYVLACSSPVSISSAKDFYIAVPAGTYTSLSVFDNNMNIATKTPLLVVTNNLLKPAKSSSLSFEPMYVEINGLKWAKYNIGATSPEKYGYYFSWGNVDGHWLNGVDDGYIFNSTNYDTTPGYLLSYDIPTTAVYDAAVAKWGGSWRMPSRTDFQKLIAACSNEWVADYNGTGIAGRLFTDSSNASNKLFFPAAGRIGDGDPGDGTYGYNWSCTYDSVNNRAYVLNFNNGSVTDENSFSRQLGRTIRPVSD